MQLTYRGSAYVSNATSIETYETGLSARFLGATYPVRRPVHTPTAPAKANLRFRGVNYTAS